MLAENAFHGEIDSCWNCE